MFRDGEIPSFYRAKESTNVKVRASFIRLKTQFKDLNIALQSFFAPFLGSIETRFFFYLDIGLTCFFNVKGTCTLYLLKRYTPIYSIFGPTRVINHFRA